MLGMLGLFYNNNKNIKKGKGNKQFINLQSFFNLKDTALNLIFTILKTNNF